MNIGDYFILENETYGFRCGLYVSFSVLADIIGGENKNRLKILKLDFNNLNCLQINNIKKVKNEEELYNMHKNWLKFVAIKGIVILIVLY